MPYEVLYEYNAFKQVVKEYQQHGGTVNLSTSPNVQYFYGDGADNHIRPLAMIYPDGRTCAYDYDAPGSQDDILSRVFGNKAK